MPKIFVKEPYKWKGEERESGQSYDVSEEEAEEAKAAERAIDQPEVEEEEEGEVEELGEVEEEEEIPEEWKKYHLNRGFSPDEEELVWTKTITVDGNEVNLVRDFKENEKGNKYATGELDKDKLDEIKENHPDLNMFSRMRDGEMDLSQAVIMAEKEVGVQGEEEKKAEEVGEEVSKTIEAGEGGQRQQMEVRLEPAMELNGRETIERIEKKIINGLKPEDFEKLVWDPEKNPNLPYDEPTASAEAYDLFARVIEMATGVQYTVENVEFRETENTYECDVKMVRQSSNPNLDGKILEGFKTRDKSKTSGVDHWRERLYRKARRNALKCEIPPTWVSRLLKNFSEKGRGR